jgi:hypothetical protein
MLVVRVRLPEDPVMVIGKVPVVALGPTLKVKTLVTALGLVPNEVVTPFGIPHTLRLTILGETWKSPPRSPRMVF